MPWAGRPQFVWQTTVLPPFASSRNRAECSAKLKLSEAEPTGGGEAAGSAAAGIGLEPGAVGRCDR